MDNNDTKIQDSISYWDARYTKGDNSGYGSYGEQLIRKLSWLSNLEVNSILDIGCGDFNFSKHLLEIYPYATYIGTDVSKVIIDKNIKNYPEYTFTKKKSFYPADLVLCIDVLFHILDDKEYDAMLRRLNKFTKYLAVTAYEYDNNNTTHVIHRRFNYKRFGKPLIREVVEKDGELYFYLFKR